jgi:cyclase
MLRSRISPFLLIKSRGLVKTRQFTDPKYVGDPINAVKIFNEKEVDELTLLDIDATTNNSEPDYDLLSDIAAESRMPLCYGGGVKNAEQAARIISLGYEKVSISSLALNDPLSIEKLAHRVGTQSVVVTLDVKYTGIFGGYKIFSHNGRKRHDTDLLKFVLEAQNRGAGEIVINSIERDGMMQGYDLKLANLIRDTVSLPITFVGGVGSLSHISDLIEQIGPVGAGVGSFFVFKGPYRAVLISYSKP